MYTQHKNPPFLKKGDKVAIVAPAKKLEFEQIERAKQRLELWGLHVILGEHVLEKHYQFAGTDAQRLSDMQWALDSPEIKAVFCARGGYGSVRIVDSIDFSHFVKNPKWIIGFSDITVFHNHIHTHHSLCTLHATVPINYPENIHEENEAIRSLRTTLFGEAQRYMVHPEKHKRLGVAKGTLVGGNLSILYSLIGTNSDIDTDGKILFLEDLSEYAYHVDRMLWAMKKAGKFAKLTGLVVGSFTDIKQGPDPFGKTAEEMILEIVNEYNYPVLFDFPAGHQSDNRTLVMGAPCTIDVNTNSCIFEQQWPNTTN